MREGPVTKKGGVRSAPLEMYDRLLANQDLVKIMIRAMTRA